MRDPIYKPGDKVVFKPHWARYVRNEMVYKGQVGTVQDWSDLPILKMDVKKYNGGQYVDIICVDQDDLVLA